MSTECALGCGKPINPHDLGTWKEVTGWVGGPRKDSMRLREDTGRYAHDACVAKVQSGQAVDQPEIFDVNDSEQANAEAYRKMRDEDVKDLENFLDED